MRYFLVCLFLIFIHPQESTHFNHKGSSRIYETKVNATKSQRIMEKLRKEYSEIDKEVKKKCRPDKRENINQLIKEAEEAASKGISRNHIQSNKENLWKE